MKSFIRFALIPMVLFSTTSLIPFSGNIPVVNRIVDGTSGVLYSVRGDSGNVFVRDPVFDFADFDTLTVTTTMTAIPLGGNGQYFEIFCDNYSTAYYVSFISDTYGVMRCAAGSIKTFTPMPQDTVWAKVETMTGKITVNRYNIRGYKP